MAQSSRAHTVLVDTNRLKIIQLELLFAWFCKLDQVSGVCYNCFTATSCILHDRYIKMALILKEVLESTVSLEHQFWIFLDMVLTMSNLQIIVL